jgi:hypothetical protein
MIHEFSMSPPYCMRFTKSTSLPARSTDILNTKTLSLDCPGVAKEKQVGNIHEVTLEVVEEGQMEEDKEREDEDKDDNDGSQLREEEEEEEKSGGEGEEDGKHHAKEDSKREGDDGEADKTSPIQIFSPKP